MMQTRILVIAAALLANSLTSHAQTAYPMLMSIEPVAARIGTSSEHTLRSRYSMSGAYAVIISGTGIQGEVIAADKAGAEQSKSQSSESLRIRLNVAADATPGVRDLRVATPVGVSTVGQLVIVADPIVRESEDSGPAQTVQTISIPAAVCGRIEKAEDVDQFKFNATEGEELSFNVACMRIQDRIHDLQQHADPILTIRNAAGSTIATSDNEFRGDPFIRHQFKLAGEYVLEIRDVRYQGNTYWGYCIEINRRPLVTGLYPVGLVKGATTPVEQIGFGLDAQAVTEICMPSDARAGVSLVSVAPSESIRQAVPVVVADRAPQLESTGDNDSTGTAQIVSLPGGINGRIEKAGDLDLFAFDAKKGESFTFDLMASRVRSSLDSHVRILGPTGIQLQLSDDVRIGKRTLADSVIENWSAPNDGRYFVEVRDLHLRGGKAFTYYLDATRSAPSFSLFADTDKTLIASGTSGVVFVRAERKSGADGEIQLQVTGLPPGVTASCGRILAGKGQDGCIVFQAAPDTKPCATNIQISGMMTRTASDGTRTQLQAHATVYQEIYQPGGGRGHWPVDNHALSVCAPGDIRRVSLSSHEIVLKPGSTQRIEVELDRSPGFDKNVTLEATYMHLNSIYGNSLPEGVSVDAAASNTLLTGGATKGHLILKADDNAPEVEKQQIAVMANVSLNFVMKATYASQPVLVTVKK